jgi:hypothetical protein
MLHLKERYAFTKKACEVFGVAPPPVPPQLLTGNA